MLLAKQALWTVGYVISLDASQDQHLPLYLCSPPKQQSVTVCVYGMRAGGVLADGFSYSLWDNFFHMFSDLPVLFSLSHVQILQEIGLWKEVKAHVKQKC